LFDVNMKPVRPVLGDYLLPLTLTLR
jgi:hypothetical protein